MSYRGAIIRPMTRTDVPELLRLMRAIVGFERGRDFRLNEPELLRRGFGESPQFGALVADAGNAKLAGMAVHYEIPFMHDPEWRRWILPPAALSLLIRDSSLCSTRE